MCRRLKPIVKGRVKHVAFLNIKKLILLHLVGSWDDESEKQFYIKRLIFISLEGFLPHSLTCSSTDSPRKVS